MVYVIAHIRGGGEMGRPWYEDSGKYLTKRNTFQGVRQQRGWGWTNLHARREGCKSCIFFHSYSDCMGLAVSVAMLQSRQCSCFL